MKRRVVIIGSGNVATSLALALKHKCEIVQIYSRTIANAQTLAQQVGCDATDKWQDLALDADVYIVSVSDDAIASVAESVRTAVTMVCSTPCSRLARADQST